MLRKYYIPECKQAHSVASVRGRYNYTLHFLIQCSVNTDNCFEVYSKWETMKTWFFLKWQCNNLARDYRFRSNKMVSATVMSKWAIAPFGFAWVEHWFLGWVGPHFAILIEVVRSIILPWIFLFVEKWHQLHTLQKVI